MHSAATGKSTVSTQQRSMPLTSTRITDAVAAKKETVPTQTSHTAKTLNKENSANPQKKEATENCEKKSEKEAATSSASNNNENKTGKVYINSLSFLGN